MRVYVPATLDLLQRWFQAREIGPVPLVGQAVTPTLREWYASGDTEELEYAATAEAARASLRLLAEDRDTPRRRVVVAVDVAERAAIPDAALGRAAVRLGDPLPWSAVAAVLVDDTGAAFAVADAAAAFAPAEAGDDDAQFLVDEAEGNELAWYATQEVADLVGG